MNINALFPSKYLKAADLGDRTPIVTIDHVALEELGQEKESRPVVYFSATPKGLILNKVNARTIAQIAGEDDTDLWPGVQVQLFTVQVTFRGELMETIRVRYPKASPRVKATPAVATGADELDEGIPF